MDDTKYSIDLRTNNGLWARVASWFVGGRLVTPEQGSQTGPVGVLRKTWYGMEMIFSRFITYITGRGEQAVAAIGWQELGDWAIGLTVQNRNQIVGYNGAWYKYLGELEHVIAGDSPENDGGVWSAENPTGKWSNIGDAALRANLGSGDGLKWVGVVVN